MSKDDLILGHARSNVKGREIVIDGKPLSAFVRESHETVELVKAALKRKDDLLRRALGFAETEGDDELADAIRAELGES